MMRGSLTRALQASRTAVGSVSCSTNRTVMVTSSWGAEESSRNGAGNGGGAMSLAAALVVGAVGMACATGSSATSHAESATANRPAASNVENMSWSAVVAEGNLIPTAIAKNSTPAKVGSDKEQGDGGVPGDGAGGKLGLRESADVVRAGLKDFRQQRAAQGVSCPAIDFRQEQDQSTASSGAATLSASFFLPRAPNILKILSTMVTTNQVLEVQPMLGKPGAAIGFCDKDRTGSLLVRQAPTGAHGSGGSVHVYRDGGFTKGDLDIIVKGYQEAWSGIRAQDDFYRFVIAPAETPPAGQAQGDASAQGRRGSTAVTPGDRVAAGTERLRQLGVEVHDKTAGDAPGWDALAGYADVKREIEDTLVMPLRHPEAFDKIARKTRTRFESNRPRAVLFEGPPGTGKTLSARIIANRSDQPMVHVPVEGIMSKWYGESEKKLSAIFDACDEMGGAIIFIDEVDALAGSRDKGDMHEATRRILSVILQKVEGFDGGTASTLICATNRKADLDAALLSRFQLTIRFGLPDAETRREVFGVYAKQLSQKDLEFLASVSKGMSCRDIKEYVNCLEQRSKEGAWRSRPAQA